jgi:hypothetical protein
LSKHKGGLAQDELFSGTDIRFINGPNSQHGQLQVEYQGIWTDICYDGFGPNEARVACKMLNGTDV